MRIIYFSKTGNIKRFVSKINIDCTNGNNIKNINEDFILITYTFKFGEIPDDVDIF